MRFTVLFFFSFVTVTLLYVPQVTALKRMPTDASTKFIIRYLKQLMEPQTPCNTNAKPTFYEKIVNHFGGVYTVEDCQYEMKKLKEDIRKFEDGKSCKLSGNQIKLMRVAQDTSSNAYIQFEKRSEIEKVLREVEGELNNPVDQSQELYSNDRMPNHLVTKLLVQYLKHAISPTRKHGPLDRPTFYESVANGVGENYTDEQCKKEITHLRRSFASIQARRSRRVFSDIQIKLLEVVMKANPSSHVYEREVQDEILRVLEEESMLRNKASAETSKRSGPNIIDHQENKRLRNERMPSDAATDLVVIYLRAATKPEKLHELHSIKATHCVNAVAYLGEKYTAQQCQLEMELLKQDFENSQAGSSHALSDLQKKLMELYMKVSAETYVLDRETEQEITETLKKVTAQRMVTSVQGSESNQN